MADAPAPGIYYDVPDAEYRAWPYPSYSLLSKFRDDDKCELEIRHAIDNPEPATEEMTLGNMVEQAIDEPDAVGAGVQVLPDGIKKRAGAAYQELCKANPGVVYLPPSMYADHGAMVATARKMAANVLADDLAAKLLDGAKRQVSFVADLEFVGAEGELVTHRVKGRLDYWNDKAARIADLKTTRWGNPRKVGASVWQYAYDVQAALYTDCMAALTGREVSFYFVFVRSSAPYVVTIYNGHNSTEMDGGVLGIGRRAYQTYLEQLRQCRETGIWHGYQQDDKPGGRVLDIQLPAWAV